MTVGLFVLSLCYLTCYLAFIGLGFSNELVIFKTTAGVYTSGIFQSCVLGIMPTCNHDDIYLKYSSFTEELGTNDYVNNAPYTNDFVRLDDDSKKTFIDGDKIKKIKFKLPHETFAGNVRAMIARVQDEKFRLINTIYGLLPTTNEHFHSARKHLKARLHTYAQYVKKMNSTTIYGGLLNGHTFSEQRVQIDGMPLEYNDVSRYSYRHDYLYLFDLLTDMLDKTSDADAERRKELTDLLDIYFKVDQGKMSYIPYEYPDLLHQGKSYGVAHDYIGGSVVMLLTKTLYYLTLVLGVFGIVYTFSLWCYQLDDKISYFNLLLVLPIATMTGFLMIPTIYILSDSKHHNLPGERVDLGVVMYAFYIVYAAWILTFVLHMIWAFRASLINRKFKDESGLFRTLFMTRLNDGFVVDSTKFVLKEDDEE